MTRLRTSSSIQQHEEESSLLLMVPSPSSRQGFLPSPLLCSTSPSPRTRPCTQVSVVDGAPPSDVFVHLVTDFFIS